jgi:hypothetical protein
LLAIQPFLLVKPFLKGKFGMIDGLLVPNSVPFAKNGLSEGCIEVNHLIVNEGRYLGLRKF